MSRLAVFFPGIGYKVSYPLFYYSRKILQKYGYDIMEMEYDMTGHSYMKERLKDKDGDREKLRKDVLGFAADSVTECEKQLKKKDIQKYERILFVGKSIGTVIASAAAAKLGIKAEYIMLTPLEYAFQITDNIEGIAFAATEDPIADYSEIKKLCTRCATELFTVSGGNHSLETGDVINDIKNLGYFAHNFEEYISGNKKTVYDFSARLHDGRETDFSKFKGKVLLIVNTATGCGFTPQYTEIESIYNKYKEDGFEVLDFPCNQFMNQAPGTSEEIHSFCRARYSISFDQFEKIEVNGEREFPLYTYLKEKRGFEGFDLSTQNGRFLDHKAREIDPEYETNNDIKWNFTKFLIDRNGHVLSRYEPLTDMNTIEDDIKRLL